MKKYNVSYVLFKRLSTYTVYPRMNIREETFTTKNRPL